MGLACPRQYHPRSRYRPHGQRSENITVKQMEPGARCKESVLRRWRPLRVTGRQEHHLDDPRLVDAVKRVHRRADEKTKYLIHMDRRKSIKALLVGTVSAGVLVEACNTGEKKAPEAKAEGHADDPNASGIHR